MAHYKHPNELQTPIAQEAIRRLRDTGAEIRAEGPLLKNINDDAQAWANLWRERVRLGIIPYYMLVEWETGARRDFEVPLARAWEIYREAMQEVSGLARSARGPSMSADPGKVEVQGVAEIHGEKVFVLRFIQARVTIPTGYSVRSSRNMTKPPPGWISLCPPSARRGSSWRTSSTQ